ncbi:MAG: ATP-binding cassette domain-containing protein [Clostridiales bacterium]|nr:ATP-binding cassette domain-containing protein [Candidatus Cacconaster stercorequi]
MSELFTVQHVSFTYPRQKTPALRDLSLTVRKGDFLVLCGLSGCGKTTLLRQFKSVLAPHGQREGTILFCGTLLEQVPQRRQMSEIGFVQQSPDNQVVTDKVWHELAFGLENLGCDTPTIRRRVAEMASFFGIQDWFHREVNTLSGGQKQLLALASVMVMQPQVLILDEPTAQLDPIAASDFLQMLGRIHRELGTTIILTEHRLEEVFPMATQAAVLQEGKLIACGNPREVGLQLRGSSLFAAMPATMRIWASVETDAPCPITVQEGRDFLETRFRPLYALPPEQIPPRGESVLQAEGLWFRYAEKSADVLKGLELSLHRGELLALLGGNGTGKSTALGILAGIDTPQRGNVLRHGRIGVLPQNPQALFVEKTVREDLQEVFDGTDIAGEDARDRIAETVALCHLTHLLDRHPYDLSGGEQQRAALAKILLLQPDILLLDEPTKGVDAAFKQELAGILNNLLCRGAAVLMVSHDVEFCASYAHRCALLFDGDIVAEGTPRAFFFGNSFYTTSANRMARTVCPQAITVNDVIAVIGGTLPEETPPVREIAPLPPPAEGPAAEKPKKLPWWRKLLAAISGAVALLILWQATQNTDLSHLIAGTSLTDAGWEMLKIDGVFLAALFVTAAAMGRRSQPSVAPAPAMQKQTLPRCTWAATIFIVLCIPATLVFGSRLLGSSHYYLLAFAVLLECMLPFFLAFEGRRPQARELVVIAVLCALGVAGRAAFFMLPQFKPILALTIISGVALGGETGFLVGAMTMLVSNMLFSQGPWTPFQMFAMGIIGFLAGVLFRRGRLHPSRSTLCVFGAITAFVIYGGIMNPVSVLIWSREIRWEMILPYYLTGFPADCVHAIATVFFLWIAAEPMLEKLERIKIKYGLKE